MPQGRPIVTVIHPMLPASGRTSALPGKPRDQIGFQAGYKYQLAFTYSLQVDIHPETDISTLFIALNASGKLTMRRGYAWDGPSGPTIDTLSFMRGALVHDALYQLMRLGLLESKWREVADNELKRICLEDGMWPINAALAHYFVRKFGGLALSARPLRYAPESP